MIIFVAGAAPGAQFQHAVGPRPFDPATYAAGATYADFISQMPTGIASPQDLLTAVGAPNRQLCHMVSHHDLEAMVIDYLNGAIGINQFMILVGSVMRPSWTNLMCPTTLLLLALQWTQTFADRINVFRAQLQGNGAAAAAAGNALVHTLNNAIPNLRYGHGFTNGSIQEHLEVRLQRGVTLNPYDWIGLLMSGGHMLSAESSAIMNDWAGRATPVALAPIGGGAIKSSESSAVVGATGGGNPIMGYASMPYRQSLRGSCRFWLPVSCDTALLLLGALVLYLCLAGDFVFGA
jgi:hypothetical protein